MLFQTILTKGSAPLAGWRPSLALKAEETHSRNLHTVLFCFLESSAKSDKNSLPGFGPFCHLDEKIASGSFAVREEEYGDKWVPDHAMLFMLLEG